MLNNRATGTKATDTLEQAVVKVCSALARELKQKQTIELKIARLHQRLEESKYRMKVAGEDLRELLQRL